MASVFRDARMLNAAGKPAWCLSYKGLDGRRHRERTDAATREEAQALLRRRLNEKVDAESKGLLNLEHLKPVLFQDFFEKDYAPYIHTRVRPSTYKRKVQLARHLLPFFGPLPLKAINAGHVEKFMDRRARAAPAPSPAEVNRERSLLSAVMNTAFRRGLVDLNEVSRVRPMKEDNERDLWLTHDEVRLILDHTEPWMRPLIVLGVNTGLREAELAHLSWSDLEHSPGWIRVGHESKSRRVRYVPINSAAKAVLDVQTARIGPSGRVPWVFVNPETGRHYSRFSVCHAFKRAARNAARALRKLRKGDLASRIEGASMHTTRHTFASWAIQRGIPLAEVQQYLGHASDTLTRRYAHLAPCSQERRSALDVLDERPGTPVSSRIGVRVAKANGPK